MNATVQAAIDAELALLEREVATPAAPFGYGTDVSLTSDLSPTLELVDAFSTRSIAEAILRRLDCPRGALVDDPDYGIDVRSMLNRGMTDAEVRALAGRIRAEVEKDDRIDTATVIVTPTPTADELRIQVVATAADARTGRFSLVLAVTSAEVLLEELRGA
jgi:hypothetical protein